MKRQLTKYYFLVIAIFIGYLLTVQIKANITGYNGIVTIPKIIEMNSDIENIKKENTNLVNAINDAKLKLQDYEESVEKDGNVYYNMLSELSAMRNLADYEKLEGPGIIITMNDSIAEVGEGQMLEWFIIHDVDILEIVNELRAAGAEAISINNERVTATSNIRCGGPTINIDGKRHAVPYVIKAIGDPQKLEAAMTSPKSYISFMEFYDIRINIQEVDRLIINAYDGKYKLNYQKKTEDGE